jgi:hypothetical protein
MTNITNSIVSNDPVAEAQFFRKFDSQKWVNWVSPNNMPETIQASQTETGHTNSSPKEEEIELRTYVG